MYFPQIPTNGNQNLVQVFTFLKKRIEDLPEFVFFALLCNLFNFILLF